MLCCMAAKEGEKMIMIDPRAIPFSMKSYIKNGVMHLETAVSIQDLRRVPTVDAEPVRNSRLLTVRDGVVACMSCGTRFKYSSPVELFKYCPQCGAKILEVIR